MAVISWGRRVVPVALGIGMLVTVLAAALAPNTGAVPAQTNCQYGACSSSTTPFPWWIVGVIAVLVAAALIGLLLFARRRRRPPAQGAPEAWQPPAGSTGATAEAAIPPVGPTTGAAAPAYLESPEDVGQGLPPVGAAAGAGAAGAAAGEEEPDIDSLMAELDKISGEILKRAPKTGSGGSSGSEPEEETEK